MKKNVMIANDSEEFSAQFAEALEKHENLRLVAMANDGEQAIRMLWEYQPDVLVLDMMLPKKDGIAVLQAIGSMAHKPVVIGTSKFVTDYVAARAADLGAQFLMLMPLDMDVLIERIEDLVANEKPGVAKKKESTNLESLVAEILFAIGVPADIKGYRYLKEAIIIAVEDMDVINAISKVLYPQVANRFQTTPDRVEGAIRRAIEIAWDRGDLDTLQRFFGYTVSNTKGKPTNSEFIALLADKLQLQLRSGTVTLTDQYAEPCSANEQLVTEVIHEIGIPAHIKGYQYLREAILLAVADGSIVYDMTERSTPLWQRRSQQRRSG